jgi:hypothetical protein
MKANTLAVAAAELASLICLGIFTLNTGIMVYSRSVEDMSAGEVIVTVSHIRVVEMWRSGRSQ